MSHPSNNLLPRRDYKEDSRIGPFNLPRGIRWGLIVGSWTLFGLFFASQVLINRACQGRPLNVGYTLSNCLSCAYIWALLTPIVINLCRGFRIKRGSFRNLLVHLAAGLTFSLIQLGVYLVAISYIDPLSNPFASVFQESIVTGLRFNLLTYGALVALSHAAGYYRKYRERELTASGLRAQLADAKLSALKMQLHPHFLFNTLNAIAVLVRKSSNQEAIDMLNGLSALLRHSLDNLDRQEVPLKDEFEFLNVYLDIEHVRFNDRLKVQMEVERDTLDAQVPSLILQPLVENAIRHGIGKRSAAGILKISARRENGKLRLEVRDDGPGLTENGDRPVAGRIGINNTRARLQQLYGEAQTFELCNARGGGAVATLAIPFRLERDQG